MKPLGRPAYGSIAHLPESKLGIGDKRIAPGQADICWTKTRDKHDRIVVQEKLDGSCVSVAKFNGELLALTRAGYLATTSKFEQHLLFDDWVRRHHALFNIMLNEGERVVGEWLAQAHGTRYVLSHPPFVAFDILTTHERIPFDAFNERVRDLLPTPRLIHDGAAFPQAAMFEAMRSSGHGAEQCEGVIYRVYRKGNYDFAAKFVRGDYIPGKYLADITGHPDVWNWYPERATP
jgi:hypothetical protein